MNILDTVHRPNYLLKHDVLRADSAFISRSEKGEGEPTVRGSCLAPDGDTDWPCLKETLRLLIRLWNGA